MLSILAVTGLAKEARLAAGPGVEAVGAGGSPERLRALLDARATPQCGAVVSFGIAGGLDPALMPGTVIVGSGVVAEGRRWATDAAVSATLTARLAGLKDHLRTGELAGVEAAVLTVGAKADLRAVTAAAAVDMESHVAAAYAARYALPFVVIRVVCDPAGRALPAFAAHALKPDGEPNIRAVLTALVRGETRIRDLARLARDSSLAFGALARCRARLGPRLGLPELG